MLDPTGSIVQQSEVVLTSVSHPVVLTLTMVPGHLDCTWRTLHVLDTSYGDHCTRMSEATILVPPLPVWTSDHPAANTDGWLRGHYLKHLRNTETITIKEITSNEV